MSPGYNNQNVRKVYAAHFDWSTYPNLPEIHFKPFFTIRNSRGLEKIYSYEDPGRVVIVNYDYYRQCFIITLNSHGIKTDIPALGIHGVIDVVTTPDKTIVLFQHRNTEKQTIQITSPEQTIRIPLAYRARRMVVSLDHQVLHAVGKNYITQIDLD